jgi:hypothetical protein
MSSGNPISSAGCLAAVRKNLMPTTPRKITEATTVACCPGAVAERTRPPAPKPGSAGGGMAEVAGRIRHGSCDPMIYNPRVRPSLQTMSTG